MSGYLGPSPVPQATQTRETFTATASQTSFATGGYQAGYIDVFLNGVKLVDGTDFTATNGSDVVLTTGAASGDTLEVVAYTAFEAANVTGATDFTVTGSFTSRGIDDNATSTAMTLDASGNVLVGTTSSYGDGLTVEQTGLTYIKRNNTGLVVNRTGTDGQAFAIEKDGTTVGSIGAVAGDLYIGTGDTGLRFHDGNNVVYPANQGAVVDATLDIGDANYRWKDLHLSGGVYLGGTGAANKLDDYESGTWTPIDASSEGLSLNVYYASYVKIGDVCHVQAYLEYPASGAAVYASIGGFPFATPSLGYASFYINSQANAVGQLQQASNVMSIKDTTNSQYINSSLVNYFLIFSGTYRVA